MKIENIPLIYILGSGHSGSTLLDLILGSHSKIESVGELKKLPEYINHVLPEKKKCTCGTPIDQCSYWKAINSIVGLNNMRDINKLHNFAKNNAALAKAILKVSGKTVLCDSSKNIERLINYIRSGVFDVLIVHLVRDGRAVAHSNVSKRKRIKERHKEMNLYERWIAAIKNKNLQYSASYSLWRWKRVNMECSNKFSQYAAYHLIRYEDLADNPKAQVSRITDALNLAFENNQINFLEKKHHNLGGNRMRMKGKQKIARDFRYLKESSFIGWWVATLYLFPLLRRFSYSLARQVAKEQG